MDPILIALVIAGGVIVLFVLAARLAWYVRTMGNGDDGPGAKKADSDGGQAKTVAAEEAGHSDR